MVYDRSAMGDTVRLYYYYYYYCKAAAGKCCYRDRRDGIFVSLCSGLSSLVLTVLSN